MNISLELPPGVPLPTLKGTLVGELDDLHIQIRFADLVDTLKGAVENGAGIKVQHGEQKIEVPAAAPIARKAIAAKKKAAAAPKPTNKEDSGTDDVKVGYIPIEGTCAFDLLVALQKGPMSSLELIHRFERKFTPANIYSTTAMLKGRAMIESCIDEEGDGTRRWTLVS